MVEVEFRQLMLCPDAIQFGLNLAFGLGLAKLNNLL